MWPFYIVVGIMAILIGASVSRIIKRAIETFGGKIEKKGVKVALYLISVVLVIVSVALSNIGAIVLLHIVCASWIVQFVNFIIKRIAKDKYREGYAIWKRIYGSSILPIVGTVLLIVFGYYNMHNVVETDYTIYTDKAIRDEGYRIALIADVHFGVSLNEEEFQKKCNEIGTKDVDVVVLCGDIIDDNASKDEMNYVFKALSSIKSEYGVFYVYGNHDRQRYRTDRAYSETELEETIEGYGIKILKDEVFEINDEFVVAGREDNGHSKRLDIDELLKNVDSKDFILVLDHQPKEYKENGKAGTDLLLSGHTHGGQIWPAGYFLELVKFDDAVYGHTQIDEDTQAIITSGFAGWSFPVKTAAPAEYAIIDIKKK